MGDGAGPPHGMPEAVYLRAQVQRQAAALRDALARVKALTESRDALRKLAQDRMDLLSGQALKLARLERQLALRSDEEVHCRTEHDALPEDFMLAHDASWDQVHHLLHRLEKWGDRD
jgi:hypothetical protein